MPQRRRVIKGLGVSSGIVLGKTRVIYPGEKKVPQYAIPAAQVPDEIDALEHAIDRTVEELRQIRRTAGMRIDGPVAKIFDAQLLIAGDHDFLEKVKEEIAKRRRNAGYVYSILVSQTMAQLRRSEDSYLRQMAIDIESVADKVLSHLVRHKKQPSVNFPSQTILLGKQFTAAEVMQYRHLKAIGFLATEGGRNSHMALIARSLLLPVIVADFSWSQVQNDSRVILDGTAGQAILNPNDDEWAYYQRLRKRQGPALIQRIKRLPQIPPVTRDGREVSVAANLELPGPVEEILAGRRIPIGLYRTEFMYLQENRFPDEEEQYDYYARIAEKFAETAVVLRTFDLGSDKFRNGDLTQREDNPALGWRGIRSMLDMSGTFKTQVRAILRASTGKNVKILLPMISDLSELEKAKRLISQSKLELRKRNIPFDENIQIGIMVEVPSTALTAHLFARRVDFMSLGTNDLTQYTMSADRNNTLVSALYTPFHPSVLALIKMTVDACKQARIPVSICGEVAGDPLALPLFVGLGVDQLSMNPMKIVDLCRAVKKIDSSLVKHLVGSVMSSGSPQSVTQKLKNYRQALETRR